MVSAQLSVLIVALMFFQVMIVYHELKIVVITMIACSFIEYVLVSLISIRVKLVDQIFQKNFLDVC